jgi:hypothetical protein
MAGVVRGARRRSLLEQAFRRGHCSVDHGSEAAGALAGKLGRSDPRFAVAAPMAGTAEDRSEDAALRRTSRRPLK